MVTLKIAAGTREAKRRDEAPAVPAGRVRGMLLAIAHAMHATRVVGREDEAPLPKKG